MTDWKRLLSQVEGITTAIEKVDTCPNHCETGLCWVCKELVELLDTVHRLEMRINDNIRPDTNHNQED